MGEGTEFDLKSFRSAFIEHAKKNFVSAGRQWTKSIENAVLGVVPGRWEDIAKVLAAAEGGRSLAPGQDAPTEGR